MTAQSKQKLNKFSTGLLCVVFAASMMLFWFGLDFLRADVFTHYYSPGKHVIVNQNPDTQEIYSWKDKEGNIYTPEDAQVKNFTWGTTALLLLVMIFCAAAYSISIKYYTRLLLHNEPEQKYNYVPRMQ